MTTIAFRDGVMAADSQATVGNCITRTTKLYVKKAGRKPCLLGFCGDVTNARTFIDWYGSGKALPDVLRTAPGEDEGFEVLVWDGQKLWVVCNDGRPVEVEDPYYAIGSGAPFALAAMDCGKSAKEAVRIACKRDIYSSAPIVAKSL